MLFTDLQARGLLKDCSNWEKLQELLQEGVVFYAGFDPTAPSLHLGHYQLMMMMKRLLVSNPQHHALVLCGGLTAAIGDPRKTSERQLLEMTQIETNIQGISAQLQGFFGNHAQVTFLNNYQWLSSLDLLTYLRDYGKFFNINQMISKEIISSRLESGISFTEFSYLTLQSIDFHYLYQKYHCQLQIGGSDQWGNIVSGLDLIGKKASEATAVGLTMPLLVKSNGEKFGKSEGQNIWLAPHLTSPYTLYQFLLNTSDADVEILLKRLTLLPLAEIETILTEHRADPKGRKAQKTLASTIVSDLHGEEALSDAVTTTQLLFSGDFTSLTETQLRGLSTSFPKHQVTLPLSLEVLKNIGIVQSNRELREFLGQGSLNVNGKIIDEHYQFENPMYQKYFLVKKGKKTFYFLEIVSEVS